MALKEFMQREGSQASQPFVWGGAAVLVAGLSSLLLAGIASPSVAVRKGTSETVALKTSDAPVSAHQGSANATKTQAAGSQRNVTSDETIIGSSETEAQSSEDPVQLRGRRFQEAFEREEVDFEWASAYESEVRGFLARFSTNSVERLECRSTLCRAVIRHDDTEARHDFAEALGSGPLTGGSFFLPVTDGALGSVAYLGRPGMRFHVPAGQTSSTNKE